MSGVFDGIWFGLGVAVIPTNIFFCFVGCLVGTLIGILPGLGPVATIAMLLPVTFYLTPDAALIMLAGIYYGAQYGGSTTAILLRMPGETSSVITCLDGHAMALKGRAGSALAIAALGSFFAGTVATIVIAFFAPLLARVGLEFGPAEYFMLMVLGLLGAIVLAKGSFFKAVAMIMIGLLLGLVGGDVNSGAMRYTFGLDELADGIDFVPLAVGLFGIAEIITNLLKKEETGQVSGVESLWPTRGEIREAAPAAARGTAVGAMLGILPGAGAALSSFVSYMIEKRISRTPEKFGSGAVAGLAGPESANNAGAQTAFIPLLTLGLPSNGVMAMMVGALMIHGITPGPDVINNQPQLFWGLIASMWVGNLMLVIINLPLIRLWVKLLKVPYHFLYPAILMFCAIGVYSVNNSAFDVFLAALFGLIGYQLFRWKCEPAPLLLGFILGPMMEEHLRRALLLSRGDPSVFVTQPISLGLLIAVVALIVFIALPNFRRVRQTAFAEE